MQSEHLRHDRLLIARYAADDSYPTEVEEARALLGACTECAALVEDIRLLSRAMATFPVPRRPRDFRITAEQADRLRGSWLDRVARRLAGPGLGTLRPVAGVALSIGLVMAVAGALPSFAPAGPASEIEVGFPSATAQPVAAPIDSLAPGLDETPGDASIAAPMESAAPPGEYTTPATPWATDGGGVGRAEGSSAADKPEPLTHEFDNAHNASPGTEAQRQESADLDTSSTSASSVLTFAGSLIAMAGLGLLIVAWLARRRYEDRLLR